MDQIRSAGFEKFLRIGPAMEYGLEGHESPWIAEGDKTVLVEGMTFSCEPGVYDPEWVVSGIRTRSLFARTRAKS